MSTLLRSPCLIASSFYGSGYEFPPYVSLVDSSTIETYVTKAVHRGNDPIECGTTYADTVVGKSSLADVAPA